MKHNIIRTFLLMVMLPLQVLAQTIHSEGMVSFKHGSAVLQNEYKTNAKSFEAIEQWLKNEYRSEEQTGGYVRIVANYVDHTPQAINKASIQGSIFRAHLRQLLRGKPLRYTFYLRQGTVSDCISFECVNGSVPEGANDQIHYTNNQAWEKRVVGSYPASAFIRTKSEETVSAGFGDVHDLAPSMKRDSIRTVDADVREIDIEIYYRFDKIKFDTTYLSNPSTIRLIDSIMQLRSAQYIDSLRIIGHASPEGPLAHNQWLSDNRAKAMKEYLIKRYPHLISSKTVITQAGGENWQGFRRMAERDPNLPMKEKVLSILENPVLDDQKRQRQIEQLNHGTLYKQYILPNYYRYLRSGASLLILYDPKMPADINLRPRLIGVKPSMLMTDSLIPLRVDIPAIHQAVRYIRPIAFKTNMLADLATLLNVEVEVPIGKHFSLMAEWNFPFWGGLGNAGGVAPLPVYTENITLQMLAAHLEARYWFPRSASLDRQARKWNDYNPLNGWFVGLYGGSGLYDFQWMKQGMQGEFFVSSGLTAGFAHPIAKHFHMEYSAGLGFLQTQYYNYTMKDGHKVVDVRDDGKYDRRQQSYFGLTKLKVSLVWIPQFMIKGNK